MENKCPLALQQFSTLDVSSLCPVYLNTVQTGNPPSHEDLSLMQTELTLISQSASNRTKQISEELRKADAFVKTEIKKQAPSDVAPLPQPPTIKLKIKPDALAEVSVTSNDADAKEKLVKKKKKVDSGRNSPTMTKRQRDDDKSSVADDASSVFGGDSVTQKKKTKTDEDKASVPTEQFDTLTPVDGVRIKPSQQVPSLTFWNLVDSHFRNFTQDDIKFLALEDQNDDPLPYLVPRLGKHFHKVWQEEDQSMLPGAGSQESLNSKQKKKKNSEDAVENVDAYCGRFTERVVSALMEDSQDIPPIEDDATEEDDSIMQRDLNKEEIYNIEQRLKRELKYLGLLDSEDEAEDPEDREDEITMELRRLQSELRRLSTVNRERRAVIHERVQDRIAYQELTMIMNELNKQVEQAFQKRQKIIQKKKRRLSTTTNTFQVPQQTPEQGLLSLLERRKRLIEEFEPIFPRAKLQLPQDSIFPDDGYLWIPQISLQPVINRDLLNELNSRKQLKTAEFQEGKAPQPNAETKPAADAKDSKKVGGKKPAAKKEQGEKKPRKKPAKPRKKAGDDDSTSVASSSTVKKSKAKKKKAATASSSTAAASEPTQPQATSPSSLVAQELESSFLNQGGAIPDWMISGDFN